MNYFTLAQIGQIAEVIAVMSTVSFWETYERILYELRNSDGIAQYYCTLKLRNLDIEDFSNALRKKLRFL